MIVRSQADADRNFPIVRTLLRGEPYLDFQSATQASLAGLSDPARMENGVGSCINTCCGLVYIARPLRIEFRGALHHVASHGGAGR